MSHKHAMQRRSYGRAYGTFVKGIGVIYGQTHYSARVAATLAWLRRELRIGGQWGVRAEGGSLS